LWPTSCDFWRRASTTLNNWKRRKLHADHAGGDPDVLFQDDPANSFYALVLSIDEAIASPPGVDQFHLKLDAAYVD